MIVPAVLKNVRPFLAVLVAAGLAAGFAVRLAGGGGWSGAIWAAVTVPVLAALLTEIVTSLRRGDVGLDVVAALSMTAALAVGETLAAAIVALMYAGGQFLEAFAERHARREMTALLSRVPRSAMRHRDGGLEEVALDLILPGDRLMIRQGDVVPVDGEVAAGVAVLDQSALTGESMPVEKYHVADPSKTEVFDLQNACFQGSTVVSGAARGVVVNTGIFPAQFRVDVLPGVVLDACDCERRLRVVLDQDDPRALEVPVPFAEPSADAVLADAGDHHGEVHAAASARDLYRPRIGVVFRCANVG